MSVFIGLSIIFTWIEGGVANLSPEVGGYINNRWNSEEYCCLWSETDACKKFGGGEICDLRFTDPAYAKEYCQKGDLWPDCISMSVIRKRSYNISMVGQFVSLFLILFKGRTLFGFVIYIISLIVNF